MRVIKKKWKTTSLRRYLRLKKSVNTKNNVIKIKQKLKLIVF